MAGTAVTENITAGAVADQDISYGVENEYRMALIGKTGCGKSAIGNNILGRKAFSSKMSGKSVTSKCGYEIAERFCKKLVVVDTPGLFDTSLPNIDITKEIVKCIGILSPGPHAFIYVVQIGRITPEEQDTITHFSKIFGEEFFKYLIVLFTHKDRLKDEEEEKTIVEYIEEVPDTLKVILKKCGYKYVAFDNSPNGRKAGEDARELIKMLEDIKNETGKSYYSNQMFEEAEREFQRRAQELLLEKTKTKNEIGEEKKKIQEEIDAMEKEIQNAKSMLFALEEKERKLERKDIRDVYRKECESGYGDVFLNLISGVGSAAKAVGSAVGSAGRGVIGWAFGI